jgi:hypothetical protein
MCYNDMHGVHHILLEPARSPARRKIGCGFAESETSDDQGAEREV